MQSEKDDAQRRRGDVRPVAARGASSRSYVEPGEKRLVPLSAHHEDFDLPGSGMRKYDPSGVEESLARHLRA
jgi:hypothetical protein